MRMIKRVILSGSGKEEKFLKEMFQKYCSKHQSSDIPLTLNMQFTIFINHTNSKGNIAGGGGGGGGMLF